MPKHAKPHDTFILREGDGHLTVSGFDPGDKALLDFGSYSDILFLGAVTDGLSFTTFAGETFVFTVADLNDDGKLDTMVTHGDDSLTLLGVSGLHGCDFAGG